MSNEKIGYSNAALWKPGILGVYSEVSYPNSSSPKHETAAKVEKMNTGKFLLEKFRFTGMHRADLPNGDTVETGIPSSPYGYGGIMVKVSNEQRLQQAGEN